MNRRTFIKIAAISPLYPSILMADELKLLFKPESDIECQSHAQKQGNIELGALMKEHGKVRLEAKLENYAYLFEPLSNITYMFHADQSMEYAHRLTGFEKLDIEVPQGPIQPHDNMAILVEKLFKQYEIHFHCISPNGNFDYTKTKKFRSREMGSIGGRVKDGKVLRDKYTIIQVSNSYMGLAAPMEEMIQLSLAEYTDKIIEEQHKSNPTKESGQHWIAVEEALTGGLVHAMLPVYMKNNGTPLSAKLMRQGRDFAGNKLGEGLSWSGYEYRNKGIDLVRRLGIEKSIEIYTKSPRDFSRMLTSS